jgi:hypothetical protein
MPYSFFRWQFCHKKNNIFVMDINNQKILAGPGKSALIFSLFDGKVITLNINTSPAGSKMLIGKKVKVILSGLDLEDGSRDKWLFRAHVIGTFQKIEGYYNCVTRTGHTHKEKKFVIAKKS